MHIRPIALLLESRCLSQKESISGKGKLTQKMIEKIQNLYGCAVKDCGEDVQMMRSRIFATLLHLSSSDAHPKHVHCPQGGKSWCFCQRAKAEGKRPEAHKDYETLPSQTGRKLVPIFNRLTDEDLLKHSKRGATLVLSIKEQKLKANGQRHIRIMKRFHLKLEESLFQFLTG